MESLNALLSRELQLSSPANLAHLWCRTRLLNEVRQLLHATQHWPSVVIQPNQHGLKFIAGDAAFGYLRWDGRLDVPMPAEMRDRLVAEGMATFDPGESESDRVVWIVRTPADADRAIWLLRLSYLHYSGNLEGYVGSHTFPLGETHGHLK